MSSSQGSPLLYWSAVEKCTLHEANLELESRLVNAEEKYLY